MIVDDSAYVDVLVFLVEQTLDGDTRLLREQSPEGLCALNEMIEDGTMADADLVKDGYIDERRFDEIRAELAEGKTLEEVLAIYNVTYDEVLERLLERAIERVKREQDPAYRLNAEQRAQRIRGAAATGATD